MENEKDYVLGTHDEEIVRLGLQHRVWRSFVLDAFHRAQISQGSHVLDVGAGPGYASLDLAEIVGGEGKVFSIERSSRFVEYAKQMSRQRGTTHIDFQTGDLMLDSFNAHHCDAVWCRWVAAFVNSPDLLLSKIAAALKPGGRVIFHEYADYSTWRLFPKCPLFELFVQEVIKSWRATGGEPDIGLELPNRLKKSGFQITHMKPLVFCVTKDDYMWQWPTAFVKSNIQRLLELGNLNRDWSIQMKTEFAQAEAHPNTVMITPMVLKIIAEKI